MGNSLETETEEVVDDFIESKTDKTFTKQTKITLGNEDADYFYFCEHEVPDEIFIEICGHFSLKELMVMSRVSKMWYLVSWKYLYCLSISSEFSTQLQLITNEKLVSMLHKCDDLKILHLRACKKLTDINIVHENHPNLIELDLSNCHTKHLSGLSKVLSKCVNLKRLNLSSCRLIKTDFEYYNCKKLKELKIRNISTDEFDDQILSNIIKVSPNIQHLDLFNTLNIYDFSFLNHLKFLKYLNLSKMNERKFTDIEFPVSLEHLLLYKFRPLFPEKWKLQILMQPHLKRLDITETSINKILKIEDLGKHCPEIEELSIQDVTLTSFTVEKLPEFFQKIKRLEYSVAESQSITFTQGVKIFQQNL
eukprot:gene3014-5024_t